ncbi:MAG: hypothetical protein ACPG4U_11665 [Pseudomonadales bacterium]
MHYKLSLGLASALFLTGCSLPTIDLNTSQADHYQLNPTNGLFCEGYDSDNSTGPCTSLLIAVSFIPETAPIQKIYLQRIKGPNRTKSLMDIIIAGNNIDYSVERLENGNYKLGKSKKTKTVWHTIRSMHESLKGTTDKD